MLSADDSVSAIIKMHMKRLVGVEKIMSVQLEEISTCAELRCAKVSVQLFFSQVSETFSLLSIRMSCR